MKDQKSPISLIERPMLAFKRVGRFMIEAQSLALVQMFSQKGHDDFLKCPCRLRAISHHVTVEICSSYANLIKGMKRFRKYMNLNQVSWRTSPDKLTSSSLFLIFSDYYCQGYRVLVDISEIQTVTVHRYCSLEILSAPSRHPTADEHTYRASPH